MSDPAAAEPAMEDWQIECAKLKALGDAAFSSKDYATAISNYTSAISVDDSNHVLFSNRCACYQARGEKSKALKDAEKLVAIKPDWAKGWGRLGAANYGLTRFEGAIKAYEKGLKVDPANKVCQEGIESSKVAFEKQKMERAAADVFAEEEKKAAAAAAAPPPAAAPLTEDDLMGDFFGTIDDITTQSVPKKQEKEIQAQEKYTTQNLGSNVDQITRLMATNHVWKNLNPFTVLMLDTDANVEDVKTRYRKLSALTHPDKNLGVPNASASFDYVKEAYNVLKEEDKRKHTADLVEAGRMRAEEAFKTVKKSGNVTATLEEMSGKEVMKLFAEIEMKRREIDQRKQTQKKREREQEDEDQVKLKGEMKFEKSWNGKDRVEGRIGNWREFGKKTKKPKFDK